MGGISPEQQKDINNTLIVIFGGFILVLVLAVLIGYVRYLEKKYALKWRERAAMRTNRHRSTENTETHELPLASLSSLISFEGPNNERSTASEPEPTVVRNEESGEERPTETEPEPTLIRPEGLREERSMENQSEPSLVHGEDLSEEIVTDLEHEPTLVHSEGLGEKRLTN